MPTGTFLRHDGGAHAGLSVCGERRSCSVQRPFGFSGKQAADSVIGKQEARNERSL